MNDSGLVALVCLIVLLVIIAVAIAGEPDCTATAAVCAGAR